MSDIFISYANGEMNGAPLSGSQTCARRRDCGAGNFAWGRPYFNPGGPPHFVRARQSGSGHGHFFVNFARNQDPSVEFTQQFKMSCSSQCDQGRGI
jgi:hypothetical protein